MKELYQKIVRPIGKWPDQIFLSMIIGYAVLIVGSLLFVLISRPAFALFNSIIQDENVTNFLIQYGSFITFWVVIIALILIFKRNRPILKMFQFRKDGNNFKTLLYGLGIGFALNGFCILMSWILKDIRFSNITINPLLIILFLLFVFIQSGAEEIITRGYIYQKLRRRYRSPIVAILGNSILFVLFHVGNPNTTWIAFTQIGLIAIFLSLIMYYFDDIWMCAAIHAGWNFTQSILFGLPNSGIVSAYSIFTLDTATARNGFFYDTGFGVEGSIGALVLLTIVTLALFYLCRNKKEKKDYWKPMEEKYLQTVNTTTTTEN